MGRSFSNKLLIQYGHKISNTLKLFTGTTIVQIKALKLHKHKTRKTSGVFKIKYSILGEARYLALQYARGQWVSFLDSDDIWHPDKLLQDSLIIKNQKVGLIYSNFHTIDENNNILSKNTVCEQRLRNGKNILI